MGTERKDNVTATQPRRRFSDRLEFKRGQMDGRAGRAPACMQPRYVAGYSSGRKQARAERAVETTDAPDPRAKPATV